MSNKNIPTKTSFSGKDYYKWRLNSVDFFPFDDHQDEFAENINKIIEIACILDKHLTLHPQLADKIFPKRTCKGELLESLQKAKSFACSTIIFNGSEFSRVFFNTPKDLENFIRNYKEGE